MKFLLDSVWDSVNSHQYQARYYKKITSSYMFIWFSHLDVLRREQSYRERIRIISGSVIRAAEHVRTSQNGRWLQTAPQHLLLVLG